MTRVRASLSTKIPGWHAMTVKASNLMQTTSKKKVSKIDKKDSRCIAITKDLVIKISDSLLKLFIATSTIGHWLPTKMFPMV